MWQIMEAVISPPQSDEMRITEVVAGAGLLVFLCLMAVLVHLRPTEEDSGTPGFVWAVGIVVFIATCALFASAGLVNFQ